MLTLLRTNRNLFQCTSVLRHFSNKAQQSEAESDSDPAEKFDKASKVLKLNVPSKRVDAVLKTALGIARNKIEIMFYENRIRLNGERMSKKSKLVDEGDEVDVIREINQKNPNFLNVSRVEILKFLEDEDDDDSDKKYIVMKVKRTKSLVIENYEDKWKG